MIGIGTLLEDHTMAVRELKAGEQFVDGKPVPPNLSRDYETVVNNLGKGEVVSKSKDKWGTPQYDVSKPLPVIVHDKNGTRQLNAGELKTYLSGGKPTSCVALVEKPKKI